MDIPLLVFAFSKEATKITKSSLSIWHLLSKRQIESEDLIIFRGLFRKHEFKEMTFLKHSQFWPLLFVLFSREDQNRS